MKLWYFIFAVAGIVNSLLGRQILWTSDAWASRFAIVVIDTFDTTPWPTHVTLDNYRTTLSNHWGNHLGQALLNSLIIGVCVTLVALLVGTVAACALSRFNFAGKGIVMGAIMGASMFPGVTLLTPLFQLFTTIGWMGTYQAR